jgi:hypothetical protein
MEAMLSLRGTLTALTITAALSLIASPAQAVTFNFADPGALAPSSPFTLCDGSGQDKCGDTLSWTLGSLTVTASPLPVSKAIIQDLDPDKGGLGIVDDFSSGSWTGNDNVNSGETLILTFNQPVLLHSATFFGDHFELDDESTFKFKVNGGGFSDHLFSDTDFDDVEGTAFYFKYGGDDPEIFYLASLTVSSVPVIPEPGTLVLLGAGLLGLLGRNLRRGRP